MLQDRITQTDLDHLKGNFPRMLGEFYQYVPSNPRAIEDAMEFFSPLATAFMEGEPIVKQTKEKFAIAMLFYNYQELPNDPALAAAPEVVISHGVSAFGALCALVLARHRVDHSVVSAYLGSILTSLISAGAVNDHPILINVIMNGLWDCGCAVANGFDFADSLIRVPNLSRALKEIVVKYAFRNATMSTDDLSLARSLLVHSDMELQELAKRIENPIHDLTEFGEGGK